MAPQAKTTFVKEAPLTPEDWAGFDSVWVCMPAYLKTTPNAGSLVTNILADGVRTINERGLSIHYTWDNLLTWASYSTDGRKTWQPCLKYVPVDPALVKLP